MKVQLHKRIVQTFRGTASREDWWVSILGALMVVLILYFWKTLFDGMFPKLSHWSVAAMGFVCATAWIPASVRRLRHLKMSPWWVVIGLVPVANIWLFVVLAMKPGGMHFASRTLASGSEQHREPYRDRERNHEELTAGRHGAARSDQRYDIKR